MTAQECLGFAREKLIRQWRVGDDTTPVFSESLPCYLDHLIAMLTAANPIANDYVCDLPALQNPIGRVDSGNFSLKEISNELAWLQEGVFKELRACDCRISTNESEIISLFFQRALYCAGSALMEGVVHARAHSEISFEHFVNEVKDYAIFTIDSVGGILSWNSGAERMKQFASEEVIGQNYRMLYREEDREDGRPERNINEAIASGRLHEQWWRAKKDGTVFWADVVMTPFYTSSGKLLGISKIVSNLSAKKRAQEDARVARDSVEAARSLKSVFIANVSHEIRTPMSAILGFSDFLKDPNCTQADRLLAADVIDRNGKALIRLIDDVLDVSEIETGKLKLDLQPVSIKAIVKEVLSAFDAQAREKGLSLSVNTDADAPDSICSDPLRVQQILCNVVGNAVKFTEKGKITIGVHRTVGGVGKCGVEFVVTDTGPGLTDEERKTLFSPFSQADSSATRKFGGLGLGLALSRRLAQMLGGDVGLFGGKTGAGCSFGIRIADMDTALIERGGGASKSQRFSEKKYVKDISGMKVLVVDDSPDNQILMSTLLKKWRVQNDVAKNGIEAFEMALRGDYDLILMDIQMPLLDGNEATRKLRHAGYLRPIVAITAHAMNDEKTKAFDSGCDQYLTKPIDKPRLREVLESCELRSRVPVQ